jgi:hypothetical protein
MQNLQDEKEAQLIIESFCPDPAIRRVALSIYGEAIHECSSHGRNTWALRVERTMRLTVMHYYVCTLWTDGVWLALDDGSDYLPSKDYPNRQQLTNWGWVQDRVGKRGEYPTYKDKSRKVDFSINGYYKIGPHHDESWPHIRQLFFDFIFKAINYGQPMDPRTPGLHSPGAVKYLRNYLGMNLPDPLY